MSYTRETETSGRTRIDRLTGVAKDAVLVGRGEISIREAMPLRLSQ